MRFPPAFARFKASDVSKRYAMRPTSKSQLDQAQRQDVADYLNATAYNDVVVDTIIRLLNDAMPLLFTSLTMVRRYTIFVGRRGEPTYRPIRQRLFAVS